MFFNKMKLSPEEQAEREYADALAQRNKALIEYVAIMTDVEIDDEEEINNESEE